MRGHLIGKTKYRMKYGKLSTCIPGGLINYISILIGISFCTNTNLVSGLFTLLSRAYYPTQMNGISILMTKSIQVSCLLT